MDVEGFWRRLLGNIVTKRTALEFEKTEGMTNRILERAKIINYK